MVYTYPNSDTYSHIAHWLASYKISEPCLDKIMKKDYINLDAIMHAFNASI